MRRFHTPDPGERSYEQQEGCGVSLPGLPSMQWATAASRESSPSLVVQGSDTGCRYLCPRWLCVLRIPEQERWGGAKQTNGGSIAERGCGTLVLDLRYFVWMCLTVKCGTTLSLLTLPSLEKEGFFFFLQLKSFCSTSYRQDLCPGQREGTLDQCSAMTACEIYVSIKPPAGFSWGFEQTFKFLSFWFLICKVEVLTVLLCLVWST